MYSLDILPGSFAVKVNHPARMSPRLLIGQEGNNFGGSPCFQNKSTSKDVPLLTNQSNCGWWWWVMVGGGGWWWWWWVLLNLRIVFSLGVGH